ncbi:hypothetical protein FHS18_000576 [Paenibacillus phyllosphaerae]|uniref:Uncharacterized protein n=1 Tax=Paenibacillus phyllosphaerae TaxID=274593 RepID=A0A7W5ATU0_9BACL|nr:hypothetical protein [Paenibacillus phyllosphaerae]MBB3108548.1 hypothetical protein [Paenibacillus phyllosphaerae]
MLAFEQAHMVFQTAFYRVVQKLGCCTVCMENAVNPNGMEAEHATESSKEASVLHLPQAKPADSGYGDSTPAASFAVHIPMVASL